MIKIHYLSNFQFNEAIENDYIYIFIYLIYFISTLKNTIHKDFIVTHDPRPVLFALNFSPNAKYYYYFLDPIKIIRGNNKN